MGNWGFNPIGVMILFMIGRSTFLVGISWGFWIM